jgi:hypothetical protein
VSSRRGDAYPGVILPGSEPITPKESAPIPGMNLQLEAEEGMDLQLGVEARARTNVRAALQAQLRAALSADKPSNVEFLALADDDDTVEGARLKAAQMQAQLDKAVADADAKRAEQQKQFENQNMDDPAAQLQGLMNAQASLHRLTANFSSKPNLDKVTGMAQKLGIPMTPELMQLGTNEAISNALVEIAVGMGKSESEIGAALGADE